jgi:hypothetical protein
MTAGPTAGDALRPRSAGEPEGRISRRTGVLLMLLVPVLAAGALGIRAVWPSSSPARLVTETNDNGYFIVIDQAGNEVGSGSAIQVSKEGDDVHVEVSASLAPGGVLKVDATMANASQNVLEFHGGVHMVVTATRDQAPWRTAEIDDASATTLAPGETFAGHATLTGAEGPAEFVFAVSVDTWRR